MSTSEKKSGEPAAGQKNEKSDIKTREGVFGSLAGDQLKVKNKEGKEFSKILAKDAKLTCDGIVCKPADLKAGSRIRFTSSADDRNVVTCVDSIVKNTDFVSCH